MKKAKIMLLSLGVLAVVGGALAFKANKFNRVYCIGTTVNNPNKLCPATFIYKTSINAPQFYYTTLKADGTPIVVASDCPVACPLSSTLTLQ